ncbi:MAG TPA: phospholipase D family protein [Burkholderiaceae bacterium]|nr:phospholipase D family protein [Burkholderiaceae bacterium]
MPSQTIAEDTQHQAERRMQRASLRVLVVSALIMLFELIGGCAALPSGVQRPVSQAVVDERTSLAQAATAAMPAGAAADQSGLRLIPDGDQALASRIALIRRAERSLDVQTYHLAADGTGALFLSELRHAAARGVRVRLLVDDLYAAGHDPLYAALAAHANVQVRMFNPLPVRNASFGGRIALSMHEFSRINRRMHNKLFIADGAFAVAGGRNIADEYYMRSAQANFVDMDVLAAGPAVRELAAVFDSYWNSQLAYPIGTLTEAVDAARFDALNAAPADEPAYTKLDRLGRGAIVDQLQRGTLLLHAARVQVLADQPSKAAGAATRTTRAAASELFAAAQSELMIVSPYFVPGDAGMAMLRQVQERGATVDVTTNSLGATDEPLVHAGYSKYRLSLLKMGVKVQELGAALSQKTSSLGDFRSSSGRLHAKLAVIDGQRLFIGSMNMDGRSERHNTELGLVIDSRELAAEAAELFRAGAQGATYRLQLADDERIEWLATEDGRDVTHTKEPGRTAGLATRLTLMTALISEDLL